jgi:hypothetical protein
MRLLLTLEVCILHKHFLNQIQWQFKILKIPTDERFKWSNKVKATMNVSCTWLKEHPLTNQYDISFAQVKEKNL